MKVANLQVRNEKKKCSFARFARAFLVIVHFAVNLLELSRPINDVKWQILQFCKRSEHLTTKLYFALPVLTPLNLLPG